MMKFRHVLAIILLIILAFMLLNKSDAAEVNLPPVSKYLNQRMPVQTVEEFAAVPYDFAKNFPNELYYWWAKAHNEREYDLATQSRRVINRVGVETANGEQSVDAGVRGSAWAARSVYSAAGSFEAQHSTRVFEFREGGTPAIIYNPYARSTHGSQNQKE
jgi:hypothetical protein